MMQITMDEVKELSRSELDARLAALLDVDQDEEAVEDVEYTTLMEHQIGVLQAGRVQALK